MRIVMMIMCGLFLCGCSTIRHELQPHRLGRLNYYDPPHRDGFGQFSIMDDMKPPVTDKSTTVTSSDD
jgi:hypothetical protein